VRTHNFFVNRRQEATPRRRRGGTSSTCQDLQVVTQIKFYRSASSNSTPDKARVRLRQAEGWSKVECIVKKMDFEYSQHYNPGCEHGHSRPSSLHAPQRLSTLKGTCTANRRHAAGHGAKDEIVPLCRTTGSRQPRLPGESSCSAGDHQARRAARRGHGRSRTCSRGPGLLQEFLAVEST